MAVEAECRRCGQAFLARQYRGTLTAFCSKLCRNRSRAFRQPCQCESCGVTFTPHYNSAGRFCSKLCGAKYRYVSSSGYWMVRDRETGKYFCEHRRLAEQLAGRPLREDEEVHHKNNIKLDNRLENLEIWEVSQPAGRRATDPHCTTCMCFEKEYQP